MIVTSVNPRSWQEDLPSERARLVRLCARLTGSYDAAEDLAQETLYETWRRADSVRDAEAWRSFASGVAKNVCLRWQRQQGKEAARRAPLAESLNDSVATDDEADPLAALEQAERADLLDRALGALPTVARDLLVQRYVEERPMDEIGARHGLNENALNVRLHRSRAALRRLLLSPTYRAEVAAYGLTNGISADKMEWQETRLWCPRCGVHRLSGRFITDPAAPFFRVHCPGCKELLGPDFSSLHASLDFQKVLGGVKGFKPALNRVHAWWWQHEQRAVRDRHVSCGTCGKDAPVVFSPPPGTPAYLARHLAFFVHCQHCGRIMGPSPLGIAMMHPEAQSFWKRHPRIRGSVPEGNLRLENGRVGVVSRFESVTDRAAIEFLSVRNTAEILEVHVQEGQGNKI